MARFMSAFEASATSPSTSSLAGLMLVNVPDSPSTSLPSISILRLVRRGRQPLFSLPCSAAALRADCAHRARRYGCINGFGITLATAIIAF